MSNCETIDTRHYASVFRALSNPHRLQIFHLLTGCCEPGTPCATDDMLSCCVGDLNQQVDIAASTLSHHLRELHQAGLIEMQRRGKQVFCSVNPDTLAQIRTVFGSAPPIHANPEGDL
ncbi:MAG: metalloregulator ArsR/SmtB family transcription factor [Gammaproteobacteria bacterium]